MGCRLNSQPIYGLLSKGIASSCRMKGMQCKVFDFFCYLLTRKVFTYRLFHEFRRDPYTTSAFELYALEIMAQREIRERGRRKQIKQCYGTSRMLALPDFCWASLTAYRRSYLLCGRPSNGFPKPC